MLSSCYNKIFKNFELTLWGIMSILILLSTLSCTSCTSRRKNEKSVHNITNFRAFKQFQHTATIFKNKLKARSSVELNLNNKIRHRCSADIEMTRNSDILIDLKVLGLIELGTLYLDNLGLTIDMPSNQLHYEYDLKHLSSYTKFRISVADLQNLILGLELWNYASSTFKHRDNMYILSGVIDNNNLTEAKYNDELLPLSFKVTDTNSSDFLLINYGSHNINGLPRIIKIESQTRQASLKLVLNLKDITLY